MSSTVYSGRESAPLSTTAGYVKADPQYVKRSDAVRIARAMRTDEIDSEIAEAIDHAIALADRRSSPYSSLRLSPLAPFPTRR